MSIDFCAITHVSLVHANTAASDLDSVPWKHDIYIYMHTHTHTRREARMLDAAEPSTAFRFPCMRIRDDRKNVACRMWSWFWVKGQPCLCFPGRHLPAPARLCSSELPAILFVALCRTDIARCWHRCMCASTAEA